MIQVRNLFRYIPRCYCVYFFLIFIGYCCILFTYSNHSSSSNVEIIVNHVNDFDLFDDDDIPFICPSEIQFSLTNRQHLAIIIASKLVPFIWKNFRALLCSGVDVYVMLDEVFQMNSSLRVDDFQSRSSRSNRSYSHRFLHVTDQHLAKFGVMYTKRIPAMKYSSWDRAIVWLYHRINLKNVWVIEDDVQWLDVRNMTYLFNRFVNDTTDVLCSNIVSTNSHWLLWPRVESDIFPKTYWTGTFSPLVRWSRRLLQHHYRYIQFIHEYRLKYKIHKDFRFQEFLMGTIAKMDNLSIEVYNKNCSFLHLGVKNMNDKKIFDQLRRGKYILHPVSEESILTNYQIEIIRKMIQMNSLNLTKMTLLKKEIVKQ